MFITDNVYAVEASKGSYVYALRTKDGITLIDTSFGGRGEKIVEELEKAKLNNVTKILLTHHDVDHIGNAALLQEKYGCDVYISELDMPYCLGTKKREGLKRLIGFLAHPKVPEHIAPLPQDNIGEIRIIPSPGHTPGHTSFLFDNCLFAGDSPKPHPPIMTWNVREALESIKGMNNLKFTWVCPAHGNPVKVSKI